MLTTSKLALEEERIRAAYAHRKVSVDKRLYSYLDLGCLFMMQEREREVLALFKRHARDALANQNILEVGCGNGHILRELIKWGARPENVAGVDVLPDQIEEARRQCPSAVALYCQNAANLSFSDATFNLVVQITAFSSALDPELKRQMAREMLRVLKPDGAILWHDFFLNNPRNPDVRGVGRKEICRLFPNCEVVLRRVTLAPPLVRRLAPRSWLLCYLLTGIRIFNTHYLGLVHKK
jgi:ubiquinone/menaquinone biosynthesis C-methylase UbiE